MPELPQEPSQDLPHETFEFPGRRPSFSDSNKLYFVYARVSKIDYSTSAETQKKILVGIAKRLGISEDRLIFKTESKSGSKKDGRPHFNEMVSALAEDGSIKNIRNRKYGGIFFYKVDRLFRNFHDYNRIEKILDAGYDFISATETIENTPTGKLLFRMLASFAIYETEKLSNRESATHLQNIIKKEFKKLGGHSVFGYEFDGKNELAIKESEAKIIRLIYALDDLGLKVPEIYERISNTEGLGLKTIIDERLEKYFKAKEERGKKLRAMTGDETEEPYNSEVDEENDIEEALLEVRESPKKDTPGKKPVLQEQGEKLIYKILGNRNYIQYNGTITRWVNINDELIREIIDSIIKDEAQKMEGSLSCNGENEIGSRMKFTIAFPELCIVDPETYDTVQSGFEKRQKKTSEGKELALFENLLFSATEDSKSKSLGWYSKKKASTYTVYYRKQANFEKEEVSEQKIEKAIIRKGLFDAAKDVEYWESVVRGLLTKNYSDITRVTLNQLRGELVFAERYRSELSDHIDYLLSKPSGDDKKDENLIRGLNSQLRIQNSIILRINKEMTELLSMAGEKIQRYISLIRNNVTIEDRRERCLFYKIAFERIILTFNSAKKLEKITVVFTDIISGILCSEKQVDISLT